MRDKSKVAVWMVMGQDDVGQDNVARRSGRNVVAPHHSVVWLVAIWPQGRVTLLPVSAQSSIAILSQRLRWAGLISASFLAIPGVNRNQ